MLLVCSHVVHKCGAGGVHTVTVMVLTLAHSWLVVHFWHRLIDDMHVYRALRPAAGRLEVLRSVDMPTDMAL